MKNFVYLSKLFVLVMSLLFSAVALAERVIVVHDANQNGLKNGHKVLAQGKGWFAVNLDENGKSAMRGNPGFKKFEIDHVRKPLAIYNDTAGNPNQVQVTPYGYFQSQSDQLSLQSGQKVCVIDSGIAQIQGETGGFNQDFDWSVITGDNDSGTGNWNADGGAHGTHVAGTIGAADNGIGVIGMAPGVPMHIIKVFNNDGWGYSSDLAQAAELCAAAGANIINMSLGGGGSNSIEENAFNTFRDNGGLALAAAGNDGNNVRSYPAGYSSVMMVGAVDADNTVASFSQFPTCVTGRGKKQKTDQTICVEVAAGGVSTLSTVPSGTGGISVLSADNVGYTSLGMENAGTASGSTYFMGTAESIDLNASGKICMIDRGNISFHDKTLNCENSGGIGAVIINNESGVLAGTLGSPNQTSIPVVGASLEDSAALLSASTVSIDVQAGDYAYFNGTSMATPTVAGVAALVWSNHPECSGENIRNALKVTAQDQGTTGRDDYYGFGIVKAKAASDYLTNNGCDTSEPPEGEPTLSGTRTKGNRQINLTWTGLNGNDVDVYINNSLNSTTANDGSQSYSVDRKSSYTFKVCEQATSTCTNEISL